MHTKYLEIVAHCEDLLEQYGDNYRGVGWTKRQQDADIRYQIMLEVIKPHQSNKVSILDFGCGLSHMLEYINKQDLSSIEYSGLDISEKMLGISRGKFPQIKYYNFDILQDSNGLPEFDYILMNGIFTARYAVSNDEMKEYMMGIIKNLFAKARVGIAFNVMSKLVEWERDDLFHLPFEEITSFLYRSVSRHFIIRHDYRLFEYTTYVYR